MVETETTEDWVYGGKVMIRQPAKGYRVNIDTILLAASLGPGLSGRFVELGCGAGTAILIAAKNYRAGAGNVFVGIERDPVMAALARANATANELPVEIVEGDAADALVLGTSDHVFFNPPYDQEGDGRAPAENRQAAYIADRPLGDWIKIWSNRMAGQASMTLIQRTSRLPEILTALEGRLGGVAVYPIRPSAGQPARRILVRAWKGSRAPFRLLAGLDLHPAGGGAEKYTDETDAILRGEAFIDLA